MNVMVGRNDGRFLDMDFVAELIMTIMKAVVLGAVGFGGIMIGKKLRMLKNAKVAREEAAE